jgi:hypothetical protein
MQYEDTWHTCFGLIRDTMNSISNNPYGYNVVYDKVITVNAGSITRLINEQTLFIVDEYPTSVFETGNYTVSMIYPEYNGEIVIGLTKKQDIDIPKLYFESNGKILYYQLNFDKDSKCAYIHKNTIIPFSVGDYVWTREPLDTSTTKNRYKLSEKVKFGVDKNVKNLYKLIFIKE